MMGVFTLSSVLLLSGCKKEENANSTGPGTGTGAGATGGAAAGKNNIVIGFIGKSLGNDVFGAAGAGANKAAEDLSKKYGIKVTVENRTPNEENAQKQAEAIEALVRSGAAGIALSCSEANTVTPAIDRAVEKGVLVMIFDSDAPNSKRQYFYGSNDKQLGAKVMSELAPVMGDKGGVAILAGNESAPNLRARVEGVRDELKNHSNIKEVGVFYHAETPEKAAEAVANATNANPSITGWAMIGGWPLFTDNALNWPAGKIKVVSADALPKQLAYLRSGYVEVLLAQDCYGWGYKSVNVLVDKAAKNIDPPSAVMYDPLQRVTKENADEVAKNWEEWLKR